MYKYYLINPATSQMFNALFGKIQECPDLDN